MPSKKMNQQAVKHYQYRRTTCHSSPCDMEQRKNDGTDANIKTKMVDHRRAMDSSCATKINYFTVLLNISNFS